MTALEKIKQWDEANGEGWSYRYGLEDIARIMDEYLKEKVEEYCKKLWDNAFYEGRDHCVFMNDVENILQEK